MSKPSFESASPVVIVRPDSGWVDFVARAGSFFLSTWIVMLALGALVPFPAAHLSFLQTALGVVAVRNLLPFDNYVYWTRPRKRVRS